MHLYSRVLILVALQMTASAKYSLAIVIHGLITNSRSMTVRPSPSVNYMSYSETHEGAICKVDYSCKERIFQNNYAISHLRFARINIVKVNFQHDAQ